MFMIYFNKFVGICDLKLRHKENAVCMLGI